MSERSLEWIILTLKTVLSGEDAFEEDLSDELLVDDRNNLGNDSADPQNRSEWIGYLREKPNPRESKTYFKMDIITMVMIWAGSSCFVFFHYENMSMLYTATFSRL